MARAINNLRSHRVIRKDGVLLFEQHPPPDILEFVSGQSQMASYGIDLQTSPKFKNKTLSYIAGTDAKALSTTFKKSSTKPLD